MACAEAASGSAHHQSSDSDADQAGQQSQVTPALRIAGATSAGQSQATGHHADQPYQGGNARQESFGGQGKSSNGIRPCGCGNGKPEQE